MYGFGPHTMYETLPPAEHMAAANARVHVTAMLETKRAFDRLDEIAATPGIDALTIGPTDLAQNLGVLGTPAQRETLTGYRRRRAEAAPNPGKQGALALRRRAGEPVRRPGAVASGLRPLVAARLDAQRARRRRRLPVAARRARPRARPHAGRPRLRRLDRGRDGHHGAAHAQAPRPRGRDGDQARARRDRRPGAALLHRLRAPRLRRPARVRPALRRRAEHEPARAVGSEPRDDVPDRVEAVHVQPDAAAPARRRGHARADRVGPRRPPRAARVRRALPEDAAARAAGDRRRRRPFRRHGATRRPRAPGGGVRQRSLTGDPMHLMYFTEQAMSAYPEP